MPIEADKVSWDSSSSSQNAPDPARVSWDQPAPASAAFRPDPHAGLSHAAPNHHQSLSAMMYPEIDFDTGLPFLDKTHLAQADNFEEKRAYLEKIYGKKNVEVDSDPYGQPMLVVAKDGKKIAAEGGGGFGTFTADVVGTGPIWASMGAGAAEGATLGAAGGPLGSAGGALLGAGIGGMFGKTVVEGGKAAQGLYRKTPGQYAEAIGEAGIGGMEGELGGKLTAGMVSKILRGPLPQFVTETTPERGKMLERVLGPEGGPSDKAARPFMQEAAPGLRHFQFVESLANKISGRNTGQDTANSAYVANRVRDILRDAGVPEDQLDPMIRELGSNEARVPTEEVGEHVKSRVKAHQEMLQSNVDSRLKDANTVLDKQLSHLDNLTRRYSPGELGVDVANGIRQARADFGTSMSKVYDKVDALVGNRKLVPVDLIRREAKRIARLMPKTSQAPVTRELATLPKPPEAVPDDQALFESLGIKMPEATGGKITFADAQRIRTMLREKSDEASLTRGVTQGEMATLANAVDYSIQQAAKDPVAAPAVRLLNSADAAYSKGIKRFQDATVKRLVKNLEAGLPPDPETIAQQIVQPGQEARVKEIRKLVGEGVWKRVAGADYSRMIRASTDESGGIDGAQLLGEIRSRRQLMSVVYGDGLSKDIEELARSLAVRDGTLPPEALAPGRIRQTLSSLRMAQETQERFLRENYLGLLGNPRRNPEQVYRWLVKPDNVSALRESVRLFGEGSPQLAGLRRAALQELLSSAKMSVADGRSAGALTEALAKYTPEQQSILFPNGMDSDLKLLGKEMSMLMRDVEDKQTASMVAGGIQMLPTITRFPFLVGFGAYRWVLSQPSVIRYLSIGLRQPPGPARQAARGMLENLIRFGAIAPSNDEGAPANEQEGDTTITGSGSGP